MKRASNDAFLKFTRNTLDQSLRDMDAATRSRLAQARARALAGKRGRRNWWLPGGVSVAITVAAVLLIMVFHGGPAGVSRPPVLEDVELLASDADLEMLSDIDFYAWLEETRDAG